MARKGNRIQVILSSEDGHQYHTERNKMNTTEKLQLKKYNPKLRKHVLYKEKK